MPYSVSHLIEGRPDPVTTKRNEPVSKALSQMIEYDFSQLPVVDEDGTPLGMVTYEGILRGIRNFKTEMAELHVRDVMVKAPIFHIEDDLFELLEQLKLTNAVLIVHPIGTLIGIVTSYDSTEYFRDRAENLMRIEDIESMTKDLVLRAFAKDNGESDRTRLAEAVSKVAANDPNGERSGKPKEFDELSLGQYISLLTAKSSWPLYDPILKIPRDSVRKLLEDVRDTRNELAHFRKEITPEQSDQLRFCAEWLARCLEEYEHELTQVMIGELIKSHQQTFEQPVAIRETQNEYLTSSQLPRADNLITDGDDVNVIAEELQPGESRYAPLADWLQSQPGKNDQVRLSFEQIEQIIGGNLPQSAYKHRAWWANDAQGHPHAGMWLEVAWRTTYLNMAEGQVTFSRIREREKAYINFFSKLLARLREKKALPVRQVSPDGTNWLLYQTVSSQKLINAQFSFSFARGKRFRIELYIDAYEQTTTKQIFDNIHAQREGIEAAISGISWERIDNKRASRIAIYHAGEITGDEQTLKALREWAADSMVNFYKTLEPIASQVIAEVLQG